LNENFNKNYRLPLKRLYKRRILENHEEESDSCPMKKCRLFTRKATGVDGKKVSHSFLGIFFFLEEYQLNHLFRSHHAGKIYKLP
jgi:hypothetical protein